MLTRQVFNLIRQELDQCSDHYALFSPIQVTQFFKLNAWIESHLTKIPTEIKPFFRFLYFHLSLFSHLSLCEKRHLEVIDRLENKFSRIGIINGRNLSLKDFCCALMFPNILDAYDLNTERGLDDLIVWIEINGERCFAKFDIMPSKRAPDLSPKPDDPTINLIGLFNHSGGIGEDVRHFYSILSDMGLNVTAVDLESEIGTTKFQCADINFFVGPVHVCFGASYKDPELFQAASKNIIFAPWELERWPKELGFCCEPFNMILGSSQFICDAFAPFATVQKVTMPFDMSKLESFFITEKQCFKQRHRSADRLRFLYSFDGRSYWSRKNPAIALNAYLALKKKHHNVGLTIKCHETGTGLDNFLAASDLTFSDLAALDISIINKHQSSEDLYKLISKHDCLLMPSSSEGFGRMAIEARVLGLDVISQKYSGMLEYMDFEGFHAADFELVAVKDDYPFNDGCSWALPSVASYVKKMESLIKHRQSNSKRFNVLPLKDKFNRHNCAADLRRVISTLQNG